MNAGYSTEAPLIVDPLVFQRHEKAVRYALEYPEHLGHMIKIMPAHLYPLLARFRVPFFYKKIAKVTLPVQPNRPPAIIDDLGARKLAWHLGLFSHDEVWPYVVHTERMQGVLMQAAQAILWDITMDEVRKTEAKKVLEWLNSERYKQACRKFILHM